MLPEESAMQANIREFLDYLIAEKGCSDNTVSAYRNDLTNSRVRHRSDRETPGGLE